MVSEIDLEITIPPKEKTQKLSYKNSQKLSQSYSIHCLRKDPLVQQITVPHCTPLGMVVRARHPA